MNTQYVNQNKTQINWEESPKGTTHALVAVMEDTLFGRIKSDNDGSYSMYNRINQSWFPCDFKYFPMRELLLVDAPQPNEFLDNLHEQIRRAYEMGYRKGHYDHGNDKFRCRVEAEKYMENLK